jgi:4a-hydroxytetrahydrobiopterin dehydratase
MNLEEKRCLACEGGVTPLTQDEIKPLLAKLNQWELVANGKKLQKLFNFKNYYHTITFVNAVAWLANKENHHPDLQVSYNHCLVEYTTHSIDALTENDFICAAKIDMFLK